MNPQPTAPEATPGKPPTTRGFAYVMTLLAMGISAVALGALLHNLVDIGYGYTGGTDGVVTLAGATLVVTLPIFCVLFLRLRRAEAAEQRPELDRPSRLAVQATLVVAFLWGLSSLVTYVYSLLNSTAGEPFLGSNISDPLGNLAHTLITVGITGAILAYWRRAPRRTTFRRSAAALAALAALAATAVLGQSVLAIPIRADRALSERIQDVALAIEDHAVRTGSLPAGLDRLPVEHSGVSYEQTGARAFTLCATFRTASVDPYGEAARRPAGYVDATYHPSGNACFPGVVSALTP